MHQAIQGIQDLTGSVWGTLAAMGASGRTTRVLFTSPDEGAGNTVLTTACGLGLASNLRMPTTVVEAHLARPALASYVDVPGTFGLGELLSSQEEVANCRYGVESCPDLFAVPSGTARPAIPGEFATDRARVVFHELGSFGRFVLFDTPPIQRHNEVRALLGHVDAAVLVLRARATRKDAAKQCVKIIEDAGVPLIGTVLNRFKPDLAIPA